MVFNPSQYYTHGRIELRGSDYHYALYTKHSGRVSSAHFRNLTRQLSRRNKASCFIEISFSLICRDSYVNDADGDELLELCRYYKERVTTPQY